MGAGLMGMVSEEDFLSFAGRVFGVAPGTLALDTAYETIPEWDSVMHLRLAMEMEAAYAVRLPFELLPEMKTLRDFYERLPR